MLHEVLLHCFYNRPKMGLFARPCAGERAGEPPERSLGMSSRKEYEEKVKAKLAELEAEIDRLRDQVKNAEAELLPEHHSRIENLHALKEKAMEKFSELVEASDESWEHLQQGMEHYWESLGNELKAFEKME